MRWLDIDEDGDPDLAFGGDSGSNELWWLENPAPSFEPDHPWVRRRIKAGGANKHHDQIFGDFDADGTTELVFWNQGANTLFLAEIAEDPHAAPNWDYRAIYSYSDEEEPLQRGEYPAWKGTHEHEGLASSDIDGDGNIDLVTGGRWFKYQSPTSYIPHEIDPHYVFTRAATGMLIRGNRPEVVLVAGDGKAPLLLYEWKGSNWSPRLDIWLNQTDQK
jgi:hypothetical protein